jgi:hypothetical protein
MPHQQLDPFRFWSVPAAQIAAYCSVGTKMSSRSFTWSHDRMARL